MEVPLLIRDAICVNRKLKITGIYGDMGSCMEAVTTDPPTVLFYEIDADGFRDVVIEILDEFPKVILVGVSILPQAPARILLMHASGVKGYFNLLSAPDNILAVYDQVTKGKTASTHDKDRSIPTLSGPVTARAIRDAFKEAALKGDTPG